MLVLGTLAVEVVLRAQGKRPWTPVERQMTVEPGGKLYAPHERLGYGLYPGAYEVTLLGTGYTFHIAHDEHGRRRTSRPGDARITGARGEIWILGCSMTYGWSVDDEDSYPWVLQQSLPDYRVVNFGVNGFGTLHAWIQLQDALAGGRRPALAVLAYGSFHDERNTFVRVRRKTVVSARSFGPHVQPYARLDGDGELVVAMAEREYSPFPLQRYSALVHELERSYNRRELRASRGAEVSEAIVREVHALCRGNGVELVLAGIDRSERTREMRRFARAEGIPSVDLSLDLAHNRHLRNLPHDGHPNAAGHRLYAQKLLAFLEGQLRRGR